MNPVPQSAPPRAAFSHAAYLFLLALAVSALYGQFLSNPLVFDDSLFFLADADGQPAILQQRFGWTELRSLPQVSMAWTVAQFGTGLAPLRMGNLLLHLAVVSVLYGLVLQLRAHLRANPIPHLDPQPQSAEDAVTDRRIAFLAAVVVALHPVAVYAVAYLVQRSTLMATLFGLLAVSVYWRGSVQRDLRWVWLSVPLYYLAVFSKEHALMLALVFPLLTVYLHADWRGRLWAHRGPLLVVLLIAAAAVYLRRHLLGDAYEVGAPMLVRMIGLESPWQSSLLTQCGLFFRYLGLWLLPNTAWLSVDMRTPIALTWQSPFLLGPVLYLAWGVAGVTLLLRRGRAGCFGLAMLFPWLLFWTELVSVRLQEPLVLYRSYLWCVGSVCLVAAALPAGRGARPRGKGKGKGKVRVTALVASLVALCLLGLSFDRLQTFAHPLLLWDDAEKLVRGRTDLPGAARIYYNRGVFNAQLQRWRPAIADTTQALQLQPDFPRAYAGLGDYYLETGEWAQARDSYTQALEWFARDQIPPQVRCYLGRARAYEALQQPGRALQDYQSACKLNRQGCDKSGK